MAVLFLCAVSCASYSPIVVPPAYALTADRRAAYVDSAIAYVATGRHGSRHPVLGDGRRPESDELSSAVDPDSATGHALSRARHDWKIEGDWAAVTVAAHVGGAVGSAVEGLELHRDRALAIVPTATVAFALVVLSVIEADSARERAQRSLEAAYATYNADLRARL